ncbi:MAG: AIR synthase related protein [Collinsella sp.]
MRQRHLASGAEPLFFLDYVAIGHRGRAHGKDHQGCGRGCKLAGCALVGGEMAEHPASWRLPTTTSPDLPWASSTVPRCSTPQTSARAM